MSKLSLGTHPFLLGFDQLERLVERAAKTGNEGYPPYNIEQTSENSYVLPWPLRALPKGISRSPSRTGSW